MLINYMEEFFHKLAAVKYIYQITTRYTLNISQFHILYPNKTEKKIFFLNSVIVFLNMLTHGKNLLVELLF